MKLKDIVQEKLYLILMDSAGIGMVLGRYKLAKMLNGDLEIINVNKSMKKIFDMSGVSRIINIIEEDKNEGVI